MWLSLTICLSLLIPTLNALNCTEPLPPDWKETYCPNEITRIEYQIPMSPKSLTGNSRAEIDLFIKWMADVLQDDVYKNYFKLNTDKIKKYYRASEEMEILKSNGILPPRSSSIKYRRSFGNFQEKDSVLKYKNDVTWENRLTTPGKDIDYSAITPISTYSKIFETKLEANIFADPCLEGGLTNAGIIYGETGTGFSAKIKFDDDKTYGTNDTNGVNMIDTTKWQKVSDDDDSFYCDCNDPLTPDCICCDVEKYFENFCSYYADDKSKTTKTFRLITAIQYIVDIPFYWFKAGDANAIDSVHASKGKFTFQVQYKDIKDKDKDIPIVASTEVSMKLYKSKTKDVLTNWHSLTKWSEGLVDIITSQQSGSSQWVDHGMCKSDTMCCTNSSPSSLQIIEECRGYETQNECDKKTICKWVSCEEVGDCVWNGVQGSKQLKNKCAKIMDKQECTNAFNGNCNWVQRQYGGPLIGDEGNELFQYETNQIINNQNYRFSLLLFFIFIIIISIIGYSVYSLKGKSDKFNSYTPLLNVSSV